MSDQYGSAHSPNTPPAAGGGVNQFGFPASGPSTYAAPTRSVGPPVRRSGGGSNVGTWLVFAVLAIALVGGGLLVFRGLGKTAQAGAQTGQTAIEEANDAAVKQTLINTSQAMETWFADHQDYAIRGPVVGITATTHVQYSTSATGYCLRAYSLKGTAQGPANGSYWWYDSQGGGLQPQASTTPEGSIAGSVCPGAKSFTKLS